MPLLGPNGLDTGKAPSPSGRVQDIAKDPFVSNRYLALSDAALWQSTDGGSTWTKLPGLERFGQWNFEHATIAFDPLVRGVVLLVSPFDRRAVTQVGVYRSTDGGQIWQSAVNFKPKCSDGSIGAPSVVVFHGHDALAAGACSVGRSTDDGYHWTWTTPDSGGGFSGVAIDSAGNRFACGQDGIFEQTDTGWNQVVDFTTGTWSLGKPIFYYPWGTCRIVASPAAANHVFFAARWTGLVIPAGTGVTYNSDVGEAWLNSNAWTAVDLVGSGHPNGRDIGVQTRPAGQGNFALYWGTDDATQFQVCTAVAGQECTAGPTHDETQPDLPWKGLGQGADPNGLHADQTRIIFSDTSPYCILLVSDDGGIQKPRAGNCDGAAQAWDYTDSGISGVEFYETSGTAIVGAASPETDLYGASQDNDAFVRLEDSTVWHHVSLDGDSFLVSASTEVRTTQLASITTFVNSNNVQWIGRRGLTSMTNPAAGNTLYTAPCAGLASRHQIDETLAGKVAMLCLSAAGTAASIYVSPDQGQTWNLEPNSNVIGHAGDRSGASLYVTRTETGANAYVIRIAGELWYVVPGVTKVNRLPANWDVGPVAVASDGSRMLTFACPPDQTCGNAGQIRIWNRSTNTWRDVPVATRMLTSDRYGTTYPLDTNLATDGQASSVAIAPHDPNLMAIGMLDTGVLLSGDGGVSWQRVPISVGNINKVWFDNTDRLYVTSYGRGMFGELVPTPDQMYLHTTGVTMVDGAERWTWTAHLRTASGADVSGAHIRFTLVNDVTGEETEVGIAPTDASGVAHGVRTIPAGSYHLLARWQPVNGAEVATDTSIVAQPTVRFTAPSQLVQAATKFAISYAGLDPGVKGPYPFDIRYRRATPTQAFSKYVLPPPWQNTLATSQSVSGSPGQEWCFNVRVHDALKRTSPWSTDSCAIVPLDDRALALATSGWKRGSDAAAYLGTVTYTATKGAALQLAKVHANGISLVVTKCPTCGPVSIYRGSKLLATVKTASAEVVEENVALPLITFPAQTTTITIRAASAKQVRIDGVALQQAP